jgi:hypothetical protein
MCPFACTERTIGRHFDGLRFRGLMGHFGVVKTLDVLHGHFYLSKMKKDVPLCLYRKNHR